MMSNALSFAPSVRGLAGAVLSAGAGGAASQPATGDATYGHPAMISLVAVGLCVLAVWVVRSIARPARLRLAHTPGRPSRLTPVHVVLVMVGWVIAQAPFPMWKGRFLDAVGGAVGPGAAEACYQVAGGLAGATAWLVLGLAVAAWTFRGGLRRGLGLSCRRWLYDTVRSVVAYLAVLPVCIGLVLATTLLFARLGIRVGVHPVLTGLSTLPLAWKAVAVVAVVVVAPLAEEVFFRGLVQSMIRRYVPSPWVAILGGSALFASMHFSQPQAVPSLFALAVALGYNYERTGRLYSPVLIHAIFNAVNVAIWQAG